MLGSSNIFLDELFSAISIGLIFGHGEELGDRGRPLVQQLTLQGLMKMKALDESENGFMVGNLWHFETHIRETLDVIIKVFILAVPYPLKIVFVRCLLTGSDEIVDEHLP